jgi:hypothetical protein
VIMGPIGLSGVATVLSHSREGSTD